jgi:hypothetical protein
MDTGLTARVATAGVFGTVPQAQPAVQTDVPTELAPPQSVTAPTNTEQTRSDPTRVLRGASLDDLEVVVDPATRGIIYRIVEKQSDKVISQVPDPTAVRLAAYVRAVDEAENHGKREAEASAKLDVQV